MMYGCAVVNVTGAVPTTSRHFGIVNLHLPENQAPVVLVSTKGLGLTSSAKSTTFGWLSETVILANDPSTCSMIVLIENNEQLDSMKRTLESSASDISRVCLFSKDNQ
jgi:hypothetical protein